MGEAVFGCEELIQNQVISARLKIGIPCARVQQFSSGRCETVSVRLSGRLLNSPRKRARRLLNRNPLNARFVSKRPVMTFSTGKCLVVKEGVISDGRERGVSTPPPSASGKGRLSPGSLRRRLLPLSTEITRALAPAPFLNFKRSYFKTHEIAAIEALQDLAQGTIEDHKESEGRDKANERPRKYYQLDPPY